MTLKDFQITSKDQFNEIAEKLLTNTSLFINDVEIEFRDIEFYWYHSSHEDKSTHEHHYKAACFRPHGAGMDITLKGPEYYGGILIRGTYVPYLGGITKEEEKYFTGPLVCKEQIFQFGNNLIEGLGEFKLGKRTTSLSKAKILGCPRVNLGKNAGDHAEEEYRFILFDPAYLKMPGVFKGGKEDQFVKWVEEGKLERKEALMGFSYTPKRVAAAETRNK